MNNDHSRQETIDAGFQEVTGPMIQDTFPGCSNILNYEKDPPPGVSGAQTENNIMHWNAVIFGPHETPFEVGTNWNLLTYLFGLDWDRTWGCLDSKNTSQ